MGDTVKKYVNKKNYPLWLLLVGFVSSIIFMATLDISPGYLAGLLGLELFLGVGCFGLAAAVLIIRAIKGTNGWVVSAETKKSKTQRRIGFVVGLLFAAPFVYFFFATLALAAGFMSIAIQQRQMYH